MNRLYRTTWLPVAAEADLTKNPKENYRITRFGKLMSTGLNKSTAILSEKRLKIRGYLSRQDTHRPFYIYAPI